MKDAYKINMEFLDDLLSETANKIKTRILEELSGVEFPNMIFGVRDKRYRGYEFSRGIGRFKKGLVLYEETYPIFSGEYTVLLPKGIFHFDGDGFFEIDENGKRASHTTTYPDWSSKYERKLDYINYGNRAFCRIAQL